MAQQVSTLEDLARIAKDKAAFEEWVIKGVPGLGWLLDRAQGLCASCDPEIQEAGRSLTLALVDLHYAVQDGLGKVLDPRTPDDERLYIAHELGLISDTPETLQEKAQEEAWDAVMAEYEEVGLDPIKGRGGAMFDSLVEEEAEAIFLRLFDDALHEAEEAAKEVIGQVRERTFGALSALGISFEHSQTEEDQRKPSIWERVRLLGASTKSCSFGIGQ